MQASSLDNIFSLSLLSLFTFPLIGLGGNLPLRFTADAYHPVPFYLQRKYKYLTWGVSKDPITRAKVAGECMQYLKISNSQLH